MIRAAIDCGTNTVRLLVRDDERVVLRAERIVRLGQGVDATRAFHPDSLARTFAAVDEYADLIAAHGATLLRFAATSAARDVRDTSELDAGVRARLGVGVDVLSGAEEARLTFLGALSAGPIEGPVMVTDIGGGSTEVVVGDADGTIRSAHSLDMGAVRLRERFLPSDPPTAAEVASGRAYADSLLDGLDVDWGSVRTWIGVAGTFTTLAAVALDLPAYDPAAVTGTLVDSAARDAVLDRCLTRPVAELVGPLIPPLRAEVIAGGALVLTALADRLDGRDVLVRDADLLDGLVVERDVPVSR